MSTSAPGGDAPVRRVDRILAFMSLGIALLSILCFFVIMIGRPLGVTDYSQGIWPLITFLPLIGLPIAFLLILALLIMSFVRRSRAAKGS